MLGPSIFTGYYVLYIRPSTFSVIEFFTKDPPLSPNLVPPITFNFQIFYQVSIFVPVFSKMPNAKRNARGTPTLEIKIMLDQVFWQNVHVKVKIVFGLLEKQSNQICSALVSIAGHFWPNGHFGTIHFYDGLLWTITLHFAPRPSIFDQFTFIKVHLSRPSTFTQLDRPVRPNRTVHFRIDPIRSILTFFRTKLLWTSRPLFC